MRTIRSLVWKEFTEIRWLWLGVLSIIFIFFSLMVSFKNTSLMNIMGLILPFLVVVYTGLIGSRAFSRERTMGTYQYLKTLPVSARTIVLVKYLFGVFQIVSIFAVIFGAIILYDPSSHTMKDILSEISNTISIQIYCILLSFYFCCFLASVLLGDTLRSFMVGFMPLLLYFYGRYMLGYKLIDTRHIRMNAYPIDVGLNWLIILSWVLITLGVAGTVFYGIYHRRFVWRTGFVLTSLVGVGLLYQTNVYINGDMKLVANGMEFNNQFPDTMMNTNTGALHYTNGKAYFYSYRDMGNQPGAKLFTIDYDKSQGIQLYPVMEISPFSKNPQFDGDKLYIIESTGTRGQPGFFYSTQYQNIPEVSYKPELVIYSLNSSLKPVVLKKVPLPSIKGDTAYNSSILLPQTTQSEHFIYLTYNIATGFGYQDWHGNQTTKQAYDEWTDTIQKGTWTDNNRPNYKKMVSKNPLTRQHILEIAKSDYTITREFDWENEKKFRMLLPYEYGMKHSIKYDYSLDISTAGTAIVVWDKTNPSQPIKVNIIPWAKQNPVIGYDAVGDYLYVMTPQKAVEIYDVRDGKNPKLLGTSGWNWIDKYGSGLEGIRMKDNLAIIKTDHALLFYDVSNPSKPIKAGKLACENVAYYDIGKDYVYVLGPYNGLSIFELPKVRI